MVETDADAAVVDAVAIALSKRDREWEQALHDCTTPYYALHRLEAPLRPSAVGVWFGQAIRTLREDTQVQWVGAVRDLLNDLENWDG